MKTSLFSLSFLLVSDLATALCFLPLLLLWWKKLGRDKAYFFIAIYWLVNGITNLPNWFGQAKNFQLQGELSLLYNLLDTPMVLLVFCFSSTGSKKRITSYFLIIFILFEIVTVLWKGLNDKSNTIIIGAGTLLALVYSVDGMLQYFKKMEHNAFENAMVYVYAGYLFNYGLFLIIYTFSFMKSKENSGMLDNFFLYYSSLILSTLLTSFGLWRHGRVSMQRA